MGSPLRHDPRSPRRPVLAAAVGLGDTTFDQVTVRAGGTLRIGGGASCDLPFVCDDRELARRVDGAWAVTPPAGVRVEGAASADQGDVVRLHDWDAPITLRSGTAWLRLSPTRPERFERGSHVAGGARATARALPLLWLALGLTLGVGSFSLWASTALRGDLDVLTLGDGPLGETGDGFDRVASLGDGDGAARGAPQVAWISTPTPPAPQPAEDGEADDDALADEASLPTEPADAPDDTLDPTEPTEPTEPADAVDPAAADALADAGSAPERATADSRRGRGRKGGGGGSFGLGGGTDDGYADRGDSVRALERVLVDCLQGEESHLVELRVGDDGRADLRSVDYRRGSWDSAERACVTAALEEWAFPGGDTEYEVSLRMRKGARKHRV